MKSYKELLESIVTEGVALKKMTITDKNKQKHNVIIKGTPSGDSFAVTVDGEKLDTFKTVKDAEKGVKNFIDLIEME